MRPSLGGFKEIERKQLIKYYKVKWHILNENNQRLVQPREELTTRLLFQHWQFALTAVHGTFATPYAPNADTIEAK